MLELLATIDPFAAMLSGLWLFAAGMFPVAFMIGSQCSPCCDPCTCTQGQLPETLTVTFSGLADQTPGPDLISVSFSSCYGSGATAKVTAPAGDPETDKGPISAVEITNGGVGYAKLGRAEPTLTISGGTGTGATFTPSLSTSQDECNLDLWSLASVAVSGGEDYVDGELLTITVAEGDTEAAAATAVVHTLREEPTLSIDGDADLTLTYTDNLDGTWSVDSVTVNDGGTVYTDDQQLTVTLGTDDVEESAAALIATTGRIEPTVVAYFPYSNGTGAVITPTLTQTTDGGGKDIWETSSLTITAAGTGYAVDDTIYGSVTDGQMASADLVAVVSSVDGNGAITGVTITQTGTYFKSDGIIQSVAVLAGGRYYKDTGEPDTVEVTNGGSYYREDPSEPPYVATVTVTVTDTEPSDGSGAELSVTIDDDTSSPTFGEITGITIDNGGDGYLAHELFDTCLTRFDGRSVVVSRNPVIPNFVPSYADPCTFGYTPGDGPNTVGGCPFDRECSLEAEWVFVEYEGPSEPLKVSLGFHHPSTTRVDGQRLWPVIASGELIAGENVSDCSNLDITATASVGVPEAATAIIVSGGDPDEVAAACKTITVEDLGELYAELTWGETTLEGGGPTSGTACGRDSSAAIAGAETPRAVDGCEAWAASVPAKAAALGGINHRTFQTSCIDTENIAGFSAAIAPTSDCSWEWVSIGPSLCLTLSRQIQASWVWDDLFAGQQVTNLNASRTCSWCYPIVSIPLDEDLLPSGAVVFGEPVYDAGTDLPGYVTFWDDLFTEENVCVDPGAPTITFSRLP